MLQEEKTSVIRRIAAGAAIGLGCILPGVSGGVMAVSFGLYRPMLDALAGLRCSFKSNLLFLLPLGIGCGIGFLLGAVVLDKLMAEHTIPLLCLFIGLIAGGVPAFIKEANTAGGGGFRLSYLLSLVAGAAVAACLLLLDSHTIEQGSAALLTWWQYPLCGAMIAVGALIPGISTSFVLIYLGWYQAVLYAVSNFDLLPCLLMAAGALLCGLLLLKLIRWCFERFHARAYYTVLGFLLVSVALVIPSVIGGPWWAYLLLPVGFIIGLAFSAKK